MAILKIDILSENKIIKTSNDGAIQKKVPV